MIFSFDVSAVSRLQFAMTAMYHWLFVPLTLGLGFIMAFMETKYVLSGNDEWKRMTKFWMKIFAVNFVIGIATGIILEFEFGTNWSNYSWFVGDIFGAPLATEGILAFFLEATFFSVMYFGWNKVSKRLHLVSTWLTAIGAGISAFWILVANAWMQYPVGMSFNPITARNEMNSFWDVVLSPVALNKFSHAVTSCFVFGAVVVIGICCWYLLKKRNRVFCLRTMKIASVFGLLSSLALFCNGHGSAVEVSKHQPMKLAAMEGLYNGEKRAPLTAFGILTPNKRFNDGKEPFLLKINIPCGLSLLAKGESDAYIPGINDLVYGVEYRDVDGNTVVIPSFEERQKRGRVAVAAFGEFKKAEEDGNIAQMELQEKILMENFDSFGYGYLNEPNDIIPPVPLTFYSFRIMVILGGYFLLLFIVILLMLRRQSKGKFNFERARWFLFIGVLSIPLAYICSQAGWIVAEVGRQPWTVQNLLPVDAAISSVSLGSVVLTTVIFAVLFLTLIVAWLRIVVKIVKNGPESVK